jgi:hypothetical protein
MVFLCRVLLLVCFSLSLSVRSAGVSPYLPLNIDSLIELDIHRLSAITKMPMLTKPYPIAQVVKYLEKVKASHPVLYQRLDGYVERYKKNSGITHYSVELGYSSQKNKALPNQRGAELDNNYNLSFSSFSQINQYFIVNGGGSLIDGEGFVPHNSYMSFGYEYMQVDLGYREHWLSPSLIAAPLLSTNAAPALSITLSNVTPVSDWNIRYEMSLSLLAKTSGIHFNNALSSGKPGLLTMHLSAQPFDWWTLGANRTFMFGGGERSIGASDIWNAIIDPVNSDNCGGTDLVDCDNEVGNQIASITTKFDLSLLKFPFSLYFEYAGEDTKEHKNYNLGNIAYTMGLFIPYLTKSSAVYLEYSDFHDSWYTHHLYDNGYSNEGKVMGHWFTKDRVNQDKTGATLASVKFDVDLNAKDHVEVVFRSVALDPSSFKTYKRSKEIEINYKHAYKSGFAGVSFQAGTDAFGKSFYRASISYNW